MRSRMRKECTQKGNVVSDTARKTNIFIMLIGIPGSGKSTYAQKLDGIIHSSDRIREQSPDWSHEKVFGYMKKMTRRCLEDGYDVIYDATNVSRKKRRDIIETVKKIGVLTKAVVFATPIDVCIERNAARERTIPEYAIRRMALHFEFPYPGEFDTIEIVQDRISDELYNIDWAISQDNPHHTLTLKEHMNKASELISEDILKKAASVHDVGKLYTKRFEDSKGNPTEIAHYYNHEKMGAYIWMTSNRMTEDNIYITQLINYHMRPFIWEKSEKSRKLDSKEFGQAFCNDLIALHKADVMAK